MLSNFIITHHRYWQVHFTLSLSSNIPLRWIKQDRRWRSFPPYCRNYSTVLRTWVSITISAKYCLFSFFIESRCEKQERTIDQMQSKILSQEKQIEDLDKHFEDILKECESFVDFMPIFAEKTRKLSESVKTVDSKLTKVRRDHSEDQTSRLSSLETSVEDLQKFKVSNLMSVNFIFQTTFNFRTLPRISSQTFSTPSQVSR